MSPYTTTRVLAGRVRLNIMDWGSSSSDPPILFLHAFTANSLASLPLGKMLAGRRRLIAPDLRGRGHSDMPSGEYGIHIHCADMIALMDKLGIERFVVAGHSFGATIAVFLAAQVPQRVAGMILYDGGAVPSKQAMTVLDAYYSNLQYRYASAEAYISRFRNAPLYQPWTDELEQLVRSNLHQEPDGTFIRHVPRYVIDADRRSEAQNIWQQLPELYKVIVSPVLILRAGHGVMGREDQVLSDYIIAIMRQGMPRARVVTVDPAGHTSLLTIPYAERDEAILQFLGFV
ncbi:MAG: alpha/beta hydrolase [Anaerolineae bacterium]|nr:alpha/beta hydrolase [Anaerolineae bacterium]